MEEYQECKECGDTVHLNNIYHIMDNDTNVERSLCGDCWDTLRKQDSTLEGHGGILNMTDVETFILDNAGKLFDYVIHKKIFTPWEIKQCYIDESVYEDNLFRQAYITEAIEVPGDVLLGLLDEDKTRTTYYKLSDIQLSKPIE